MVVYLDHAATTPMRPEAIAAYADALRLVGNPSSIHSQGQHAKRMLEEARETVAATLGLRPDRGGVHLRRHRGDQPRASRGIYWARNGGRPASRAASSSRGGEHHATVDTVEWLERSEGAIVHWLPLDSAGPHRLPALRRRAALHDDIALVTLPRGQQRGGHRAAGGGARGARRRVRRPGARGRRRAYGHLPDRLRGLRRRTRCSVLRAQDRRAGRHRRAGAVAGAATVVPLIHGGGQQRQVRSGTQDVAGRRVVRGGSHRRAGRPGRRGCAAEAAARPAHRRRARGGARGRTARATRSSRACRGNAHFTFPGAQGDSLLFLLDCRRRLGDHRIRLPGGHPRAVARAARRWGGAERDARGALRFTLGRTSTDADVDALLAALPAAYAQAASRRPCRPRGHPGR